MEKHYIIIDNCTYMYRIKYKHIKSIYIRIEKGEIVAVGSHLQLLNGCAIYQELYRSQLGGEL